MCVGMSSSAGTPKRGGGFLAFFKTIQELNLPTRFDLVQPPELLFENPGKLEIWVSEKGPMIAERDFDHVLPTNHLLQCIELNNGLPIC